MIDLANFASLTDVQWRGRMESERGLYVAEGSKTIERALHAGHTLRGVISEARWLPQLLDLGIERSLISVQDSDELEAITGYHVHRGALAAFDRPSIAQAEVLLEGARRVVVIEDVVDHTNVGAIMRSAAAFAIDAVLLSESCADPLYRRAIKVSMGAVFAVPWARIAWPAGIGLLREHGFQSLALTPDHTAEDIRSLTDGVRAGRLALVLGTEGDGLSKSALERCDRRVRIAMTHDVDSLNVAAAAAVACFELTR